MGGAMIEQKQTIADSATSYGVYGAGGLATFFMNLPDHIQFITLCLIAIGVLFRTLYDVVKFFRYLKDKRRK